MDADFLLVQRMRMGDEKALESFVEKYYPPILRYCRVHVADFGYAEDMAQETFARFFQTLPGYRHFGKAANYLYTIAANACRDFHRKNREVPVEELPECPDMGGDSLDMRLDIQAALWSLPGRRLPHWKICFYTILERRQGKRMLKYELKKVYARKGGAIAMAVLVLVVGLVCWFATDVYYVDQNGIKQRGGFAIAALRAERKAWAGYLDEEKLRRAIAENRKIKSSPEYQSGDETERNIAYGRGQGTVFGSGESLFYFPV